MKKLLLVSMICLLVFSFTTLVLAEEKVHLTFWTAPFIQSEGKEQGWYERERVEEFERMYPNVEIEVQVIPWVGGKEKLEIAIASDTTPDIFFFTGGDRIFDLADRGLLVSCNEVYPMWEVERLTNHIRETCFIDGEMMLLPWEQVNAPGIMVNVDLAKKAGAYELLPLDDPYRRWNHEEALAFFRKCKVLTEEGIYPYCIPAGSSTGDMSTRELMVNFGMEVFNKEGNKLIMNSPEGVRALEWIVNLNDEGLIYPNPETTRGEDFVDLFFDGKLVSWYGAGVVYTTQEKWTNRVPNSFLVQFPTIDGVDPKCRVSVVGFGIFDKGNPIKERYAKLFCKYYTTFDPFICGGFPPFKDAVLEYENENVNFMARCGIFAGDYFGTTNSHYPMLREVFYPELQAAFLHIKTPQDALDDLCATMNKLIEE